MEHPDVEYAARDRFGESWEWAEMAVDALETLEDA